MITLSTLGLYIYRVIVLITLFDIYDEVKKGKK